MRTRADASSPLNVSRFALHQALPPRAWQPGPLHWVLAGSHVAGVASIAVQPALWPWAVAAMCGSHALNLAFGFAPATTALGPVISELPPGSAERGEVALTFDDGPDANVTPRVLDLLDEAGAQATFFCVGARARAYPNVVREIASRGHAVENHAFGHSRAMGFWGVGRMVRDIGDAQKALGRYHRAGAKIFSRSIRNSHSADGTGAGAPRSSVRRMECSLARQRRSSLRTGGGAHRPASGARRDCSYA